MDNFEKIFSRVRNMFIYGLSEEDVVDSLSKEGLSKDDIFVAAKMELENAR